MSEFIANKKVSEANFSKYCFAMSHALIGDVTSKKSYSSEQKQEFTVSSNLALQSWRTLK
jgi:hypothetical protein